MLRLSFVYLHKLYHDSNLCDKLETLVDLKFI
jgi:hypothetical protein